jgi:hypothetical protein
VVFIGTKVAIRKERRQLLWTAELDRFFKLEALAGELTEFLRGYRGLPSDAAELTGKLETLESEAGRFARHAEVRQAIRDLHQTLACMWVAKRGHEKEEREIRLELEPAYRKLLAACDKVLGRDKTLGA